MNTDNISKLIKRIRQKNNLTQKEFALKYNVTYQAVSKWENGINIPDMSILSMICKDYNISLDEIVNGNKKKNKKIIYFLLIFLIILTLLGIFIFLPKKETYNFKKLTSSCEMFSITGTLAYDSVKSSIYITNIKYCGDDDNKSYKYIECNLYEVENNIEKKIDEYTSNILDTNITLDEFLKEVTLSVDNYDKLCKEYTSNSLYLSINATKDNDEVITYKIPLNIESC